MKTSIPNIFLRLEGLTLFIASTLLYFYFDGSWVYYLLLILLPDIGMIGYLINNKIGSITYNITHTTIFPIALLAMFLTSEINVNNMMLFALIWLAHIGMDRLFGFGLKYPSRFKDTHMQHV